MRTSVLVLGLLLVACGGAGEPDGGGSGGGTSGSGGGTAGTGGGATGAGGGTTGTGGGTSGTGGGVSGTGGGTTGSGGGATGTGGGTSGSGGGAVQPGPFYTQIGFREAVPLPPTNGADLEVDSLNRLHVLAGYSGADAGLLYSVREIDGGWTTERVAATTFSGSLELDSQDRPHVLFFTGGTPFPPMMYANKNTGAWVAEEVESATFQVGAGGFVVDSTGAAHAGYLIRNSVRDSGFGSYSVMYSTRAPGGGWTRERVAETDRFTSYQPALAVDGTNRPYVMYFDRNDAGQQQLFYGYRTAPDTWQGTTFGNSSMTGSAAAVAPGDVVHLAAENNLLRFTRDAGFHSAQLGAGGGFANVMRAAADGTVWDFSRGGTSSGRNLRLGRYAAGARQSADSGVTDVFSQGWDFDSTGHPWGAVGLGDGGVSVLRLD